jgi:RNA polymerase sigma-54 factor
MYQVHYQTSRPQTTAHLAQTMTLLALTTDELKQQIDTQISQNPALEILEERRCPLCKRILGQHGSCSVCSKPSTEAPEEPIVFLSPRDDFYSRGSQGKDEIPEDNYSTQIDDLPTFVLRQVAPDLAVRQAQIAAYLVSNLDDDGFLTIPLFEIAQYFHVPLSEVQEIQKVIQRVDPIGVGSSTTQEALIVQLEVLSETCAVPDLAMSIIQLGVEELSQRQFSDLAKRFGVSQKDIRQTVRFIGENLNPFPGRSHWGDSRQSTSQTPPVFHQPDIMINHLNDDPLNPLTVEIIMPLSGTLRVNPQFRHAVREASGEKKDMWKSDLEHASLLVKCLQQRNHTMLRLMQRIVVLQKDFILYGEKYIKPYTRVLLAKELELHESTISRAVANKAVQLPNRRIIPLAQFFSRNLNVRSVLREIIEEEPYPYSDTVLVDLLAEKGYKIARRTVAKYRAMEGILPAHMRRSP